MLTKMRHTPDFNSLRENLVGTYVYRMGYTVIMSYRKQVKGDVPTHAITVTWLRLGDTYACENSCLTMLQHLVFYSRRSGGSANAVFEVRLDQ